MLIFFVIGLLCVYIAYYWKYLILYRKIGGYNPIPLSIPLSLNNKTLVTFTKNVFGNDSKYSFYLVWFGPMPVVVSLCPELCKIVLNDRKCKKKSKLYQQFSRFIGSGLLIINNPEWAKIKTILGPAFRQTILKSFLPIFNYQVNILIKNIEKNLIEEKEIDLFSNIEKCVFDFAYETIGGKEGYVQRGGGDLKILDVLLKVPVLMSEKLFKPWYHIDYIYNLTKSSKIADKYVRDCTDSFKTILAEKEVNDETHKNKRISIDLLYDSYKTNEISYEQLEANITHLLGGSFETTAFTFFSILMCLAMYPDYQEKVFQEVYEKFPRREFEITFEDIRDLSFLKMFIKEVLRLLPSIPCIGREVEGDISFQNDVIIPKGSTIVIDIFNLHRNPKYWGPNAEIFDPYNFLPDNITKIHPYAYIPFSKGQRTCIGEKYGQYSLRLIAAKMIRNFQFSTDYKLEDLRFQMDVTLKLQEYPKINMKRREK